jgi:CheY-like chemotaxis protein
MVSPVGIEPTTNWLKANCSTTELRARPAGAQHTDAVPECQPIFTTLYCLPWENARRFMPSARCLIIDPDPQFASILSGIVSRHGLDVEITADPFAALRTLRMQAYDLVLYDMSDDRTDHDTMLGTLERELPAVLARTVIVTTAPLDASRVPAGVPVVGKHDLAPLMRYLERE